MNLSRRKKNKVSYTGQYSAEDIAKLSDGAPLPAAARSVTNAIQRRVSFKESNALYRAESDRFATRIFVYVVILVVLAFVSLGFTGAAGAYYYPYVSYAIYTPVQTFQALYEHVYNGIASLTHWYAPHTNEWISENVVNYWQVVHRAQVLGITLICAVLLGVSGMLYQNVFKNPMAGPGMLGVSTGVSMGMMLVVAIYGSGTAALMVADRYKFSYAIGAAILVFVILAGKKLSGKGKPFDIITMLLIGSVLSQLLGFIVSYMTLFVMSEEDYLAYYTISQMLTVDTSLISWVVLGIASVISLVPVILLRHKMTALALDDQDARVLGIDLTFMRAVALICGAIMILAAQIHVGMVSLVSLIVPFLSRKWFGCEFNKQLIGSVLIGTILMLIARDITDAIPFIGGGLSIGSIMSVCMLPLFIYVMASSMKEKN